MLPGLFRAKDSYLLPAVMIDLTSDLTYVQYNTALVNAFARLFQD